MIIDELLTDFLGASLRFDPLPLDTYAQTEWKDGGPVVTVDSLAGKIDGVKDEQGVQNVAKFHEAVHVVRDLPELKPSPQLFKEELGPPSKIVCHRRPSNWHPRGNNPMAGNSGNGSRREFWAEEAGRAAAISYAALARSDAFQAFIRLRQSGSAAANGGRWRLLYEAAEDIGVIGQAYYRDQPEATAVQAQVAASEGSTGKRPQGGESHGRQVAHGVGLTGPGKWPGIHQN